VNDMPAGMSTTRKELWGHWGQGSYPYEGQVGCTTCGPPPTLANGFLEGQVVT
jgi:hypothetical protein